MSHRCHALECTRQVAPQYLMCGKHWAMVPKVQQTVVYRHYRPGQEVDKQPTYNYLLAMENAVLAVAKRERLDTQHIERNIVRLQRKIDEGRGDERLRLDIISELLG